jgi:hypothetical protein
VVILFVLFSSNLQKNTINIMRWCSLICIALVSVGISSALSLPVGEQVESVGDNKDGQQPQQGAEGDFEVIGGDGETGQQDPAAFAADKQQPPAPDDFITSDQQQPIGEDVGSSVVEEIPTEESVANADTFYTKPPQPTQQQQQQQQQLAVPEKQPQQQQQSQKQTPVKPAAAAKPEESARKSPVALSPPQQREIADDGNTEQQQQAAASSSATDDATKKEAAAASGSSASNARLLLVVHHHQQRQARRCISSRTPSVPWPEAGLSSTPTLMRPCPPYHSCPSLESTPTARQLLTPVNNCILLAPTSWLLTIKIQGTI